MNANLKHICKKITLKILKYVVSDIPIAAYFLKVILLFKKYKKD